jgi:hypothetical protein
MKNWYETFSFSPKRLVAIGASDFPGHDTAAKLAGFTPIARTAVADEVKLAESKGSTVRGIGSRWSSGDVMATGGTGMMTWMPRILACAHRGQTWRNLSPALGALRSEVTGTDRRFVHVEAGLTIHALISALAVSETSGGATREAWCIPNMGASSGQTLIGAISTASHGGAFDRRPLADNVRAIRLVGSGGVEHWIEAGGGGAITGSSLAEKLPGVQIHRDDELFGAALVTVGSIGLITELVLEVVEMFGQAQSVVTTTWDDVKAALRSGSLFTSATALGAKPPTRLRGDEVTPIPEGLEIFINPYRSDDDYAHGKFDRRCVAVMRARAEGSPDSGSPPASTIGFDLGTWLEIELGDVGHFRRIVDRILTAARPMINRYLPTPTVLDTYYDGEKQPGLSLEVAIPTTDNAHLAMMEDIFDAFDELIRDGKKFAGFFSMRFTMPSRAFLAMQNIGASDTPRVCHLEMFALKEIKWTAVQTDGNAEGGTEPFLRAFVAAAEKRGARLHWGQIHHLDRHQVAADYAAHGLHAWRRARTRLSRSGSWRTFSNSFSRRVGLESYHEAIAATSPAAGRVDLFAYAGARLRQLTITGDQPGTWAAVPVKHDEEIAAGLAAVTTGPDTVEVYAETDARDLLRLRFAAGAWSAKRFVGAAGGGDIAGPWAAVEVDGTMHLFATDRRGRLRWTRIDGGDKIDSEVVVPDLPSSAGRFLSQVAACADNAGHLHVIGVGSNRMLIRGRHDASGWTWGFAIPQPQPRPPFAVVPEAPPAVVAVGVDQLMVFAISHGQAYRMSGRVSSNVWPFDVHPVDSIPPDFHYENVTRDRGGDDAYQVIESETRFYATPCGPVAAAQRGSQVDLFARADTGAIVWSRRVSGRGWLPQVRLPPPG